jgi:hypothetical protein
MVNEMLKAGFPAIRSKELPSERPKPTHRLGERGKSLPN